MRVPVVLLLVALMESEEYIIPFGTGRDFNFPKFNMTSFLRVVGNCPLGKQVRDGQ